MNFNKKLATKTTTLKSLLLKILLFILGVNFLSGVFANRDFGYVILTTISSLLGMGISITIVYYLVNNKSFDPIDQAKGDILVLLTFPFFLAISVGVYFVLDFIINLF